MKHALVLATVALAGLSACTGSVDPATGTVFDNFRNIQSGEFDRQIASRRAQANAIIAENRRREANIAGLESQRRSNASQIGALRGQVARLDAEIAAARQAAANDPGRRAQLDALSRQAAAVEADVARGGDAGVASSELARIRSAVRALSG